MNKIKLQNEKNVKGELRLFTGMKDLENRHNRRIDSNLRHLRSRPWRTIQTEQIQRKDKRDKDNISLDNFPEHRYWVNEASANSIVIAYNHKTSLGSY